MKTVSFVIEDKNLQVQYERELGRTKDSPFKLLDVLPRVIIPALQEFNDLCDENVAEAMEKYFPGGLK